MSPIPDTKIIASGSKQTIADSLGIEVRDFNFPEGNSWYHVKVEGVRDNVSIAKARSAVRLENFLEPIIRLDSSIFTKQDIEGPFRSRYNIIVGFKN